MLKMEEKMTDWNKWLKKRELCADNILYVYRRDRKTIIHREDAKSLRCLRPYIHF